MVAAGSGVALRTYGYGQQDLVLLVVGGLGAAVVAAAHALVALVAARVAWTERRRPGGGPAEVECERVVDTGFRVADPWLPFVDVRWTWDAPPASLELVPDGRGRRERVVLHGRGAWDTIARRFVIADAFGVARVAFVARETRRLRALPSSGELGHVPLARALGHGEDHADPLGAPRGDLFDLRPYAPGDPIRHVLWKVYARTRELVVRVPERALAPVPQTVAFLVGGAEAPAGAVRVAIEGGLFGGDFRFAADGVAGEVDRPEAALDVVVRSGLADGAHGAGLAPFLTATRGMRRAMVFTPARPGPWLDAAIEALGAWSGGDGAVEFVVCTDGVDRAPPRGRVARAVLADPEPAEGPGPVTAAELDAVVRALGRTGARVLVVDRATGAVA